jgi:hypothetical protein
MKLLRQLLKGPAKFHWLGKKEKTARETKVYSDEEAISLLVEAKLTSSSITLSDFKPKQKGAIFIHHIIKSEPLKSVVTQIR